jgi:hypothetical protein
MRLHCAIAGSPCAPRARHLECARSLQHEPIAQASGHDLQSDRQPAGL